MIKQNFKKNILHLLKNGKVENITIDNPEILMSIIYDKEVGTRLKDEFLYYFMSNFDESDLYLKTEDFIYRMHLIVNKCIIEKYGVYEISNIKNQVNNLLNNEMDFYGAVSYSNLDDEIIDECSLIISGKDISTI